MTLPPKAVSVMCVMQSAIIIGSYLLVGSFNKCLTKINQAWQESGGSVGFFTMPWAVRSFMILGPWLLAVPFAWGTVSIVRADSEGGIVEVAEAQAKLGYAITALLALLCVTSVWKAFFSVFDLFNTN